MSNIVISVENLSKSYLVGHNSAKGESYTALRDVIARNARNLARKTKDMLQGRAIVQGDEVEEFWALKDVSFEVEQGDRIGIIGRNGAGKSTLLKILSRITEPTKGRIKITGRVASLLEVGTGFHPELTGRENIFLNGAILGMTRREIQSKFDEIVEFAEVEKFLDTPVKRYSSGMYVRLAFAVAAHLEPEILIVDEVLAVGDAQFQKKCLGKMEEVGKEGRTVLFVSHNMTLISSLCAHVALLKNGRIINFGKTDIIIREYFIDKDVNIEIPLRFRTDRIGCGGFIFTGIKLSNKYLESTSTIQSGEDLIFAIDFEKNSTTLTERLDFEIGIYNSLDQLVFLCGNNFIGRDFLNIPKKGRLLCRIPDCPLSPGSYSINLYCGFSGTAVDWIRNAATLNIAEGDFFRTGKLPPDNAGYVFIRHTWDIADNSLS